MSKCISTRRFARSLVVLFGLMRATLGVATAQEPETGLPEEQESLIRWPYYLTLVIPEAAPEESGLLDVFLPPVVFTNARVDLADLRLATTDGRVLPYALRELRAENVYEKFKAQEFNRSQDPDRGTQTVTLDLQRDDIEHNQVEIDTTGDRVRRIVRIEGGSDGTTWQPLGTGHLLKYPSAVAGPSPDSAAGIDLNRVTYPTSRFRYLRVEVDPDPVSDRDPWEITRIQVVRRIDIPGEMQRTPVTIEPREATRAYGQPASAWFFQLGGDQIPCERLEVEIEGSEFARDYQLEAGGRPELAEPFYRVTSGTWQRRAGEEIKPMEIAFGEVRAARLRLTITDYQNPPLGLVGAYALAPARQLVFARPAEGTQELRLYYGNTVALSPNYDFARNLPRRLDPPPTRLEPGSHHENPEYVPAPKPLTERWPALTYVVLGLVSLLLGGLIVSVARAAMTERREDEGGRVKGEG